jgi:hypothetical protein
MRLKEELGRNHVLIDEHYERPSRRIAGDGGDLHIRLDCDGYSTNAQVARREFGTQDRRLTAEMQNLDADGACRAILPSPTDSGGGR